MHVGLVVTLRGGTVAAAPPPFRPSDPALCGSRPLVTPHYCRLRDLLCLLCVYRFVCLLLSLHTCILLLFPLFDLSFVVFPSVLWYCWLGLLTCKNRLPYNLYCVGGDVKHCSLTHYSTLGPVSTWIGDHLQASEPSQCETSHLGQLSLLSTLGR